MRREQQTTQVLNESASARRFTEEFQKVTQPFSARLQALNAHPLAVVQELLKADHTLSNGTKAERAQFLANLVRDYDVDIVALDNALAGRAQQEQDPRAQTQAEVDRLLAERLAPFQHLLQREQEREQQDNQVVHTSIQSMAQDHARFPYFEDVRLEMADILDLAAKRGRAVSLEEAYNRATMLDPEISKLVTQQTQAAQAAADAAKANAQAQRARRASVSVGGSPSGLVSGSPAAGDRRATIEAAFDAIGGR
jgi:tetratricopeptide (TPR) repeat protein